MPHCISSAYVTPCLTIGADLGGGLIVTPRNFIVKEPTTNSACSLMPGITSDNLDMEPQRWKKHCAGISHDKSIIDLLPNIRELLCILVVLYQLVVLKQSNPSPV